MCHHYYFAMIIVYNDCCQQDCDTTLIDVTVHENTELGGCSSSLPPIRGSKHQYFCLADRNRDGKSTHWPLMKLLHVVTELCPPTYLYPHSIPPYISALLSLPLSGWWPLPFCNFFTSLAYSSTQWFLANFNMNVNVDWLFCKYFSLTVQLVASAISNGTILKNVQYDNQCNII